MSEADYLAAWLPVFDLGAVWTHWVLPGLLASAGLSAFLAAVNPRGGEP